MINKNAKMLGGLLVISLFIVLIYYIPRFFEQQAPVVCFEDGICQHEEYADSILFFVPLILVFGFVFGTLVSYLYFEKKVELPKHSPEKKKVLLSILSPSERKIISKIVDGDGKVLQSEISRVEGVGKVRAHRVIDRLMRRGVLEKEELGKTNVIRLRKDIFDALKSDN